MDDSNDTARASTTTPSNSPIVSGLPASTTSPADAPGVAAQQSVTELAHAATIANEHSDNDSSSAVVCHEADERPERVVTAEGEELQKSGASTAAAAASITAAPTALEAAERTQQRHHTVSTAPLNQPAAAHASTAASGVVTVESIAATPFRGESAGPEARASNGAASGGYLLSLGDTVAPPTPHAAPGVRATPVSESMPPTDAPALCAPAAPPSASVRISILPPKAGQEKVLSAPLLAPVAATPAVTCSDATARPPKGAAVASPDDYAAAPSLRVPGRCYSLFPPRGVSAQLSPAQTTTSRSPVSNRSPGMQTPQQQQEEEYKQYQQKVLWQQEHEQQGEQDQLPERALQEDPSLGRLHRDVSVAASRAEPVPACVEDGDTRKEEQLQQQLQQLHHSLLAQLAASSTTAAAVSAAPCPAGTTPAAALASTAGAGDTIPAASVDMPAGSATWTVSGTPAAAGVVPATTSSEKGGEHPKAHEQGSTQKQPQPNSSGGAAFASSAIGVTPVVAITLPTNRTPSGASEGALPSVEQRVQVRQHLREQQAEQERQQGQQEAAERQQNQEVHFSTLFRAVSAASLPGGGEICSGGATEKNSSCNLIQSDKASFCSSININCRLSMALPSPGGTSETEATAETHASAGRDTANGCSTVARFDTFPRAPQQGQQQSTSDGQRDTRKRHSIAGTLMRRTAAAALAAAALELRDGGKDPGVDVVSSSCTGSGKNFRRACEDSATCSSGSKYDDYQSLFQSSSNISVRNHTGFEKSRSSRSHDDLSSIDNSIYRECLSCSGSKSNSKRQEEHEQEDRCCSTSGWATSLEAETHNHHERRNSATVITDKERAALRAALLVRQDCLQRFLQATQQALSALEDSAEGVADTDQLLSVLNLSDSFQKSSADGRCSLPAPACLPPLFGEMYGPPSHLLAAVSRKDDEIMQQKSTSVPKQPQRQSEETAPRPLRFSDTALPRTGVSPPNRIPVPPHSLGTAGVAPHLASTVPPAGGNPCTRIGRGLLNSERGRGEHLVVLPNASSNSGRSIVAGGNRLRRPLSDVDKAAATVAAAAAAKAVAAAAASLLEQQRQQVQQQQIQQHVQQRQCLEEEQLHLNREQQCAVTLGTSMESEEREPGNGCMQRVCETAPLPRIREHETANDTSDPSSRAHLSNITAADDDDSHDAATSPSSFGARGGIRSKTAPAFSLDDKSMRGFLSFLSGGEEGDFSAADAQAALLLHRQGESAIRAAQPPYFYHPDTSRAAVTEALAAVMRAGESFASSTVGAERRERPRVRFRDQRPPQQQDDLNEQHGFPEPHDEFLQEQQTPQQHRHTQPQQQQDRVSQQQQSMCSQSPNQAKILLHRKLHMQQCRENKPAAVATASLSSTSLKMSREAFLNAIAAAAAAAAADRYEHSVAVTAEKYARPVGAAATQYERNQVQSFLEAKGISPVARMPRPLAAEPHAWNQSSSTTQARSTATSSDVPPWTAVSLPLESQQRQQQQREVMGSGASAAAMRPLPHPLRIEGIAAAFEQQQQQNHVRNPAALFMRPQRRTVTLPCTAANVLFQSMDVQALLHLQCRCKPCAFYYNRKGCRNGMNCEFCHHEDHSRLTVKQWKKQQHKLTRQARCLNVEEERAITGVAGLGANARSGDAGSLFSAARSQVVVTPSTPSHISEIIIPAAAFPLTWEDEKSSSSTSSSGRGTEALLRSGEFSSNNNCARSLPNVEPDTSSTRCAERKGTGCYIQPAGFSKQAGVQLEGSFQADEL